VAGLLAGSVFPAPADPLYRWIDNEGRLHLSDQPPSGNGQRAERLDLPDYAAPIRPPEDDPYSILNQLERLEVQRQRLAQERREREQAEREYYLRRRELEARQRAVEAPESGPVYVYPRPVFPQPPAHRPTGPRPGSRPPSLWEPDHPAYRPYPRPPAPRPLPSTPGSSIDLRR
jgi:hypothetical protein